MTPVENKKEAVMETGIQNFLYLHVDNHHIKEKTFPVPNSIRQGDIILDIPVPILLRTVEVRNILSLSNIMMAETVRLLDVRVCNNVPVICI